MAKLWRGQGKVYVGTISSITTDAAGTPVGVSVHYEDGDNVAHDAGDESWDLCDFAEPGQGSSTAAWTPQNLPYGARVWVLRHMEATVKDKIHAYITLKKPVRKATYSSVLLDWSDEDHKFFFNTLDDLLFVDDQAMVQWLCPMSKELPWKRIGHVKGDQRIQVCAKGLARRTKKGRTKIFFAYSRFDLVDGVLVNQYEPVQGIPGKKKAKSK